MMWIQMWFQQIDDGVFQKLSFYWKEKSVLSCWELCVENSGNNEIGN